MEEKMKKRMFSGMLVAAVAVAGQFVQPQAGMPAVGMQQAEAFSLGGALGSVLNAVFQLDMGSMQSHQQSLMKNLAWAAQLEAVSAERWGHVANVDTARAAAASNSAKAFLQNGDYSLPKFKAFHSSFASNIALSDGDKTQMTTSLDNLMTDKDKLTTEQNTQYVTEAKKARRMAATYNAMAAKDAAYIIHGAVKAFASGNLGDQLSAVQSMADVAKEAQSFLKLQRDVSKERANLTQKAEKAMNVKDPSDKDAKAYAKSLGME